MSKAKYIFFIFIFVISNSVVRANAEDAFTDLDYNDPSIEAIESLKSSEIIEGYSDGTFKSLNKINRAEFLKIVIESITDNPTGSNCFSDVGTDWYAKYVCYAKYQGIVKGYNDESFKPGDDINFAEASKIISNAFEITEEQSGEIWYESFVRPIAEKNAIPMSISDLDKKIYRGEMAEVIWRLKEGITDLDSLEYEELEAIPVKIESCEDLQSIYKEMQQYQYYYITDDSDEAMETSNENADGASSTQGTSTEDKSDSSDDYSETNVQVDGVDEADIVKNDGEYIYMIKGNEIRIIKAYPEDEMKEMSKIQIDDMSFYPHEIYLDSDLLVIIGNGAMGTSVYSYNIEDRSNPVLNRSVQIAGYYSDSRKIDDTLYLILNKSNYYYYDQVEDPEILIPSYKDSLEGEEKKLANCDQITYFPRQRNFSYIIVSAIPLDSGRDIESEVILGSSENIYSSKENLYIASTNYDYNDYYYDWNNAKTVVYRYALDGLDIEFQDRAKVPGTILDQFSMDEDNGYFRIATTVGNFWSASAPSNNLYILESEDMEIVGKIEGIAKGERIYSTRFMGDRGYMVTFKNTDPLFVFDMKDPFNPKITGELKIPGYSDYLHPYDENHLIGFGKDAVSLEDTDFALYQGMKISLFDITDITNPKEMFSEIIGDRGTDSEVLYDHKALLFDKDKNLLAFPIAVAELASSGDANTDTYGKIVFQGSYVYDVDLESGFNLRGKITHYDTYDYDNFKNIKRIIYIGKNLYTISEGFIKASDIDTTEEKNMLELEGNDYYQDNYYYEE